MLELWYKIHSRWNLSTIVTVRYPMTASETNRFGGEDAIPHRRLAVGTISFGSQSSTGLCAVFTPRGDARGTRHCRGRSLDKE